MKYPIHNSKLAWRVFNNRVVILNLDKDNRFFELNEAASLIWQLADGTRDIEALANAVYKEFEIDLPLANKDTDDFILTMNERGLIQWRETDI